MKKLVAALLFITAGAFAATAWAERVLPLPPPDSISLASMPVCHGFGCRHRAVVALPAAEWQSVAGWFFPEAATPAAERAQIAQAVGWMEVVVGRHGPTHNDLALNWSTAANNVFGQLDCIDEAVNTTTYLRWFAMNGLLRHHIVVEAAYRRSLFDQHWAAQVEEKISGDRFVIDSWFRPNGHLPVVQRKAQWSNLNPLSGLFGGR